MLPRWILNKDSKEHSPLDTNKRLRNIFSLGKLDHLQTPFMKSVTRKNVIPKECSSSLLPKKYKPKFDPVEGFNIKEYLLKSVKKIIEPFCDKIEKEKPKPKKEPILKDTKFSKELEYYVNRQKNGIKNYFDKSKKNGQNLFKALKLKPNLKVMDLKKLNCNYTSKRKLNTQSLITNQTLSKDLNCVRNPREYIKKLKIPKKPQLSVRTRTAAHKTQNTKPNHNLKCRKMSQQPKKPLKPAKTPKPQNPKTPKPLESPSK
ncbi:unnamed protein product [Moneuplotes crassus]|uniref:Uncharacterized protein n=1 Tax=Euplotes crassus TaxID=5936 RepID=A0AAD1X4E8_EUPCR|nr:unnamed protein product [Moneuplotes crassus]